MNIGSFSERETFHLKSFPEISRVYAVGCARQRQLADSKNRHVHISSRCEEEPPQPLAGHHSVADINLAVSPDGTCCFLSQPTQVLVVAARGQSSGVSKWIHGDLLLWCHKLDVIATFLPWLSSPLMRLLVALQRWP